MQETVASNASPVDTEHSMFNIHMEANSDPHAVMADGNFWKPNLVCWF